ncbi:hypothetical protein Hypma_000903 [Hypsizygus marmoreus]|uniref:Uncharacterized protein n=1 Tax=Hypsizygus marmoreus TaxID=39966 RepID=A0A369JBF2_HYPMA|nr:hypothetical protein Hypma_000903 [Hypsizygus marmoreus]
MDFPSSNRTYTQEEKQQLLANLDIEVAHRTRQFESWLADRLENFNMHQEGQVSRIPKQVRNMTMREFGEKYNGNIQAALRGFQKERFVAAGGEGSLGELDKEARKRKWVASHDIGGEGRELEAKAPKTARLINVASPKKVAGSSTGPGTAQRARLLANKTPGGSRTMGRVPPSPSPQKPRPPFGSNIGSSTYNPRRPTSPAKPAASRPTFASQQRVPSTSIFNPELPPKTPRYPSSQGAPPTLRLPRKDESMLSVNGSPLANPYEFGMGWLKGMEIAGADTDEDDPDMTTNEPRTLKRAKSSIMIRRDPSVAFPPHLNGDGGLHSRTNSQASLFTAPSQPPSSSHSPDNSQSSLQPYSHSQPSKQTQPMYPSLFPSSHSQPTNNSTTTPRAGRTHTRSFSALVAIPTKDGHLLEFDPLQTSPGALDALEGISDSAKKQARAEMGRLVQATMDKWKIG